TRYLLDAGRARDARSGRSTAGPGALPDVSPMVPKDPPRAYLRAAKTRPINHYVEFFEVSKAFPTREGPLTVVDGFNLRMNKGEFVSLIGHSGCGKSTVLSMAAGLTEVGGGGIVVDGREVSTAGPDRAVVFQAP